jgi:transposase
MREPEMLPKRDWPLKVRRLIDEIAGDFMAGCLVARERAANHDLENVRLRAERDDALWKLRLANNELSILRRRLSHVPPARRPDYAPEDRFQILQHIRLAGWFCKEAARHFVISRSTLQRWRGGFVTSEDVGDFFGKPPWNKLSDGMRCLVHEIKELCPEAGAKGIAGKLKQAGIQASRASVQRILREEKPAPPGAAHEAANQAGKGAPPPEAAAQPGQANPADDATREPQANQANQDGDQGQETENAQAATKKKAKRRKKPCKHEPVKVKPYHILAPKTINRTWHIDLTTFKFLFFSVHIAACLDGFSRKILALRVYIGGLQRPRP